MTTIVFDGIGSLDVFDIHPFDLGSGEINYTAYNPECWLWTGPEPEAHWIDADDINNEVASNDYQRQTLPNPTWTQVGDKARLNSDPVDLPPQPATLVIARGYILILRKGVDGVSPVLCWGYLDNSLQDEKSFSEPELLRITPGVNGWFEVDIR